MASDALSLDRVPAMTDVEFKDARRAAYAVDGPNCGDMLAIFAEAAAEHALGMLALATFETVVASPLPGTAIVQPSTGATMTENDSTPAEMPAAMNDTTPAEHTPAEHYQEHHQEQPAHEETPADYEEPADLGEILEDRPKKLSGAQRAKLQRQYLENEVSAREQRMRN